MIRLDFEADGINITPTNYKDLSIDLTFDAAGEQSSLSLSTNEWTFDLENAKPMLNHYRGGLTGGFGVFTGFPFKIRATDLVTNQSIIFKQYLDFTQGAVYTSDSITVSAEEIADINWLSDTADSFSFEYLHERTSFLPASKFVSVPYVINSVPNYRDVIITIVSTSFIISELSTAFEDLSSEAIRALDPMSAIGAVLVVAFRIIKVIALILILIRLIKDIIDFLIQPVKYHMGMYVQDLIGAACDHLGVQWNSTFLKQAPFNDLLIMPRKQNAIEDSEGRLFGFTQGSILQKGYYDGTFGDLLRALKLMFNAKVVFKDNVLWIVKKEHSFTSASYTVPKLRPCDFRLNTDEIKANYLIQFQTDVLDRNTIRDYTGTVIKAQHQPIIEQDRKLRLIKGLNEVNIPFALGKRKEGLNAIEKIVKGFLDVADGVLNALIKVANSVIKIVNTVGKIIRVIKSVLSFFGFKTKGLKAPKIKPIKKVDFGQILDDRIGMLMLEDDTFNVPKMLLVQRSGSARQRKIKADNKTILSARYLWENFHYTESFAPYDGNANGNQWFRYSQENVPFCFKDYLAVKENNKIFDYEGRTAKIESVRWNIWRGTADIEYRVNKKYTNNLRVTLSEPTGL